MRKPSALALLVVIMYFLLLPLSAFAAVITGRVTGKAGDAKGLTSVTLNGPNAYSAMTNSTGDFRVQNVVKGRYTVTVSQGNNVQRFVVDIDGTPRLDLRVRW
jgi:hypothetical protein